MRILPWNQTIYLPIATRNASGVATDADSLPTAAVYAGNAETVIESPTVVTRSGLDGSYYVPLTITEAAGYAVDTSYCLRVTATVGGVTQVAELGCVVKAIGDATASNQASMITKVNQILSGGVTFQSFGPVNASGDLDPLIPGDAYLAANGRAAQWTLTNHPYGSLAGCEFHLMLEEESGGLIVDVDAGAEGISETDSANATLSVDILTSHTDQLEAHEGKIVYWSFVIVVNPDESGEYNITLPRMGQFEVPIKRG